MKGFILSAASGLAALFGLSAAAAVTGVTVAANAAGVLTAIFLGLPGVVSLLVMQGML